MLINVTEKIRPQHTVSCEWEGGWDFITFCCATLTFVISVLKENYLIIHCICVHLLKYLF